MYCIHVVQPLNDMVKIRNNVFGVTFVFELNLSCVLINNILKGILISTQDLL